MPGSCFVSQILGSSGMDGLNFSCSSLTIIVSGNCRSAALVGYLPFAVVMTKPKEKDGVTKYHVYRRVSILDLTCSVSVVLTCPCFVAHPLGSADIGKLYGPSDAARK